MPRKVDLTGQRFGRLVVVAPLPERDGGSIVWECRCDCGNSARIPARALASNRVKSCGCYQRENGKGQLVAYHASRAELLSRLRAVEATNAELLAALKEAFGIVADLSLVGPTSTVCAWASKAMAAIENAEGRTP